MTQSVTSGVSWTAFGKIGAQAMQFLAGLVVARLVTPEEYGIVVSLYAISGFAVLFFDLGLAPAIVHLRPLTDDDLDTAFWLNALAGVVFTVVMSALGPLIAVFFHQPSLVYLAPVVSLSFAFSLGAIHFALLERALRFTPAVLAELGAAAVGFATTVLLAIAGLGPMALALGPVAQSVTATVTFWAVVPWRPRRVFRRSSFRRLWRFSKGMLGFNAVNYWGRNADNVMLGRFAGAAELGFYNRAYNLMLLPVQQVAQVLGRVLFPAMTAIKDDKERVRSGYRRALRITNLGTLPVLAGISATAPALVPLLWGKQWVAVVPFLQILSIAGMPQCLSSSSGWIYQAYGETMVMFRFGVFVAAGSVGLFALGLAVDGAKGVAWAVLVQAWVFTPLVLRSAGKLIDLPAARLMRDALPGLVCAGVMGGAMWAVPIVLQVGRTTVGCLLLQALIGALVYGTFALMLQRTAVRELLALLPGRGA